MPPPPDLSEYLLSPEESARTFGSEVLPAELLGLPPSTLPRPLAVLAVGQTGAGKTRLCPPILDALRSMGRSPAHFIADTYKTYHPRYSELLLNTPQFASAAAGPDARRWLSMAAAEAVKRRLDVVLESACRHPSDFIELYEIFHRGGYRLEIAILAVPEALSRLGIITRFYEKLPEAQSGQLPLRLTPNKVHDDSYRGLLEAAAFLDSSGVADQVIVVRRGNLVAFSQEKSDGSGRLSGIADAVRQERERPLTPFEAELATADMEKLSAVSEASILLEPVKKLMEPLVGPDVEAKRSSFSALKPLVIGNSAEKADPDSVVLRLGVL
ncbi:zeta toxin family protein [Stachybotrys elegans]|uniref:Zeta toxin family protein n=1 Tax=Stachybotrys elegans TaxID=80388 RepID=A0A8K0WWD8_9HYPO|nr:zeta toxin family protein [Stachybotrys elegans]